MWMIHAAGWCARMFWWLMVWPIGLVLSIRRGNRKRHQEMLRAMTPRPPYAPGVWVAHNVSAPANVLPPSAAISPPRPPVPPPPPGFVLPPPPPPV